jgi:alpha-ketoglutarate-dependent taurine dioxygenase
MQKTFISTAPRAGSTRGPIAELASVNLVWEDLLREDEPLPLVVGAVSPEMNLSAWIAEHRAYLQQKLHEHGGILFRDFHLPSATAFERAAGAICNELYAEYGDLPTETGAAKVYTSTPYPEELSILYHNESSHLSCWPRKINFFCVTVAQQGGATPIVDCRKIYQQLHPKVRHNFEQKGVTYVRNFHEGLDVSWQKFFCTEDRSEVEESCRRSGSTCEWIGDDLRIKQNCRAVLTHPDSGEKSFFNQVQLHHVHCLPPEIRESVLCVYEPEDLPRNVYYGDGTVIDDATMDHIGDLYERNAVRFQWQEGDMVCLDNMLTAHARDPFVGPRKVLVTLGDMVSF